MASKRRNITLTTLVILGAIIAVSFLIKHEKDVVEHPKNHELSILPETGTIQVGVFDTLELVFTASLSPANPFDTYLLKLEITDPTGRRFNIDGFYDGDGKGGQNGKIWKARLTPYQTGVWNWKTIPGDAGDSHLVGLTGQFEAVAGSNKGGVISDGKSLRFQNGEFVYLVANFLDFNNNLRSTHTFMSETTNDTHREAILARQSNFHKVNSVNLYIANKGDYNDQSVTPWLGSANDNDKAKMDLSRWKKYDGYIQQFKQNRMITKLWLFADESNFGGMPEFHKQRLARYTMARTSAFSHTMYVIALEWQEEWEKEAVSSLGEYIQAHNSWGRALSVHSLTLENWEFGGESWPTFISTQSGNSSSPEVISNYNVTMYNSFNLPHIDEEYGILRSNSDPALRARMWANFASGAAGGSTGSDLLAFQRFMVQSRVPFQRMTPANNLVSGGGTTRFARAEQGHHYVVYSISGSFTLDVSGSGLIGYWFNPADSNGSLSQGFSVSPGTQTFTPPGNLANDWVLLLTDGSGLNSNDPFPSAGANMFSIDVPPPGPVNYTFKVFIPLNYYQ